MRPDLSALLLAVSLAGSAGAEERLLFPPLEGFEVGHRAELEDGLIIEWVPEGEAVESWTEIVTLQEFPGLEGVGARAFADRIAGGLFEVCPEAEAQMLFEGEEGRNPVVVFLTACPGADGSETAETTLFKLIEGREALYALQKAWRVPPEGEVLRGWLAWIGAAMVCEAGSVTRPCPSG